MVLSSKAKNTDGHYQTTGKLNLYCVIPTFYR